MLAALYSLTGFVMAAAYVPQIFALYRTRGAARSVSLLTWSVWTVSFAIMLLYSGSVGDGPAVFFATANFLGCASVTALAALKRRGAPGRQKAGPR